MQEFESASELLSEVRTIEPCDQGFLKVQEKQLEQLVDIKMRRMLTEPQGELIDNMIRITAAELTAGGWGEEAEAILYPHRFKLVGDKRIRRHGNGVSVFRPKEPVKTSELQGSLL